MADYISFNNPQEHPPRQYDPKKHIVSLLRQAKEILDKAVDDAEAAEDIEKYCLPLLFEIANIYFYLGLLGENIHIHLASQSNKTNKSNKADETVEDDAADETVEDDAADELPRHRCENCEWSEIILQSGKCWARCKLTGRINRTRHAGCDRYQPFKEMVVKKDERRCWMCNSFHEDTQIKNEGLAYTCPFVGHAVVRQDKACRAFEPSPDIEVES